MKWEFSVKIHKGITTPRPFLHFFVLEVSTLAPFWIRHKNDGSNIWEVICNRKNTEMQIKYIKKFSTFIFFISATARSKLFTSQDTYFVCVYWLRIIISSYNVCFW